MTTSSTLTPPAPVAFIQPKAVPIDSRRPNGISPADLLRSMTDDVIDADGFPVESLEQLDPAACWPCPGETRTADGYGRVWHGGRAVRGHRLAYALTWKLKDPREIPVTVAGRRVSVDHLCDNRECVNPWHLELKFHEDNYRRGRLNGNTAKTECLRGHSLEGENLLTRPGRPGKRECVRCARAKSAARNYFTRHRPDVPTSTRSHVVAEVLRRLALLASPSSRSWGSDAYALAPVVLAEVEAGLLAV